MPSSAVRMLGPELLQNLPRWFIIKLWLLDFSNTDAHYASVTCSQDHICVLPSPLSAPLQRNNHLSVWISDHILLLSASPPPPFLGLLNSFHFVLNFIATQMVFSWYLFLFYPAWIPWFNTWTSIVDPLDCTFPLQTLWDFISSWTTVCLLFLNPGGRVHAEENRISVLMGTTTNRHISTSAGPLETKVRSLSY